MDKNVNQLNRFDMIANQMMKGINGSKRQGNIAGTVEEVEDFKRVYRETISHIEKLFPKSRGLSVGLCGAIGKAFLWYGKEKIQPFAEAIANREFNGRSDPCFGLWEWMIRNSAKRDPNDVYRRTVTAIRMFLRGGKYKTHLKPAIDDIFEWKNNYRWMQQPKRNQHTNNSDKSPMRQPEEAILADIEDMMPT